MESALSMQETKRVNATGRQIKGTFRLLVFEIGNHRMSTPVEMVRTIADYDDSVQFHDGETGGIKLNLVDIVNLYFPDESGNQGYERKLIVLKSNDPIIHGVIVDRVFGVGTFSDMYPVPTGIFNIPDGIITHLVCSEEPWMEVVNLQKIAEINIS